MDLRARILAHVFPQRPPIRLKNLASQEAGEMDGENGSGFPMPDPSELASRGASAFAKGGRVVLGKEALGLSLVPWAAFGLMCVLQPG
jgi:hypothetical protein